MDHTQEPVGQQRRGGGHRTRDGAEQLEVAGVDAPDGEQEGHVDPSGRHRPDSTASLLAGAQAEESDEVHRLERGAPGVHRQRLDRVLDDFEAVREPGQAAHERGDGGFRAPATSAQRAVALRDARRPAATCTTRA